MSPTRAHLSIGEVLSLLQDEFPDVTISKIRFLESQGLLDPERTPSGYRKFYEDDIERLRWILLQQRENFLPLRVIKARLEASAAAGLVVPLDDGPSVEDRAEAGSDDPAVDGADHSAPADPAGGDPSGTDPSGTDPSGTDPAAEEPAVVGRPAERDPDQGGPAGDGPRGGATPAPAAPGPGATGGGTRTSPVPGWRLRVEQAAAEAAATPAPTPAALPAATPTGTPTPDAAGAGAGAHHGGPGAGSPLDPGPSGVSLTREELAASAGLDAPQLAELERFGLLRGRQVGAEVYFDGDALVIARGAAGFLRYGIEARHLRMYKVAAEREAGFYEQVILPLLKQRNPEGRRRAMEILVELARLGEGLHDALLRASLADYAGS